MNVKLLRKVQKHILAEPERYDQNAMLSRGTPGEFDLECNRQFPKCGTIACIGGWTNVLAAKNPERVKGFSWRSAQRSLGLNKAQATRLFAYIWNPDPESGWPAKFTSAYRRSGSPKSQARVAARRIDHFIATKGAE